MTATLTVNPAAALIDAAALSAARSRQRPATPAALAKRTVPAYHLTPTLALISDVLADAISSPDRRYIISTPPRTGKSMLVSQVGTVFALMADPDAKVILASYADSLAEEHSREARRMINEHSAMLGLALSPDKTAVGRWRVDGRGGGLLAAGILSGITGFGASSVLLVDDPTKNAAEADSAAYRRRVIGEFRSTLMTRLHPGASVVIIASRWHPDDLAGVLLADEPDRWTHINIPAIAEAGIPDALGRAPGVAMTSALGRTLAHLEDLRASVGQRTWYAEFQGVPASPEGGLIKRNWLDDWRMPAAPQHPLLTVVGVDPSDSGSGDSCGLVAASVTYDGVVAVIADQSAPMTSDEWARAAVELALDVGASEISIEAFSAGATYVRVAKDALARRRVNRPIRITAWPPRGSQRGRGDAVARSSALLQGLEVGTCRLAGHLPEFEEAAVTWQAGQHQPDALSALVVAHDVLSYSGAGRCAIAAPIDVAGTGPSTRTGGGLGERLGGRRPLVDMMVAEAAAAKADAAVDDGDEQAETPAAQVTAMADYLARRGTLSRRIDGSGSTPFGPGYDPLAHLRYR